MEWFLVPREEQETIINIDYYEKTISVYTTRKQTGERLIKKIGKPDKIDYFNGAVSGVFYKKNLYDKDIAKFFSKGLLVGCFRNIPEEKEK